MAGPLLAALAVEFAVFRWYFGAELSVRAAPRASEATRTPRFALVVLGLTLLGFVASSPLHVEPFWAALAGAAVLAVKRVIAAPREAGRELRELGASANPWFLAFVAALSVVVQAVVDHGVADALRAVLPRGDGLPSLLLLAGLAALLANLVNNLPAVPLLLPLVAASGSVAVLAVLIGVNVGPNLTYVGSLATLLWRRIMADHDHDAEIAEFTRLGLLTVPPDAGGVHRRALGGRAADGSLNARPALDRPRHLAGRRRRRAGAAGQR